MEKYHEKFVWSKEAVIQLIDLWRTFDCLYNPKHRFYHNKKVRYAALTEITEGLQMFYPEIRANDVKMKITYLRGQYSREIAKFKVRKMESDTEEPYVPSPFWFEKLHFLEDFIRTRKGGLSQETVDDSWDSHICNDKSLTQPYKKARTEDDEPTSSRSSIGHGDDSVHTAPPNSVPNITSVISMNAKNEAFCNFMKTELQEITNPDIRDELIEDLTTVFFKAKKKQRQMKSFAWHQGNQNREESHTCYY